MLHKFCKKIAESCGVRDRRYMWNKTFVQRFYFTCNQRCDKKKLGGLLFESSCSSWNGNASRHTYRHLSLSTIIMVGKTTETRSGSTGDVRRGRTRLTLEINDNRIHTSHQSAVNSGNIFMNSWHNESASTCSAGSPADPQTTLTRLSGRYTRMDRDAQKHKICCSRGDINCASNECGQRPRATYIVSRPV